MAEFAAQRGRPLTDEIKARIDEDVRRAAYHIIEGKKATYYGIGSALARITDVILRDQSAILTVCAPADEVAGVQDVTVALPYLVSGEGVVERLPLPVSAPERRKLADSAGIVKEAISSLG